MIRDQVEAVVRPTMLTISLVVPIQTLLPVRTFRATEALLLLLAGAALFYRPPPLPKMVRAAFVVGLPGVVLAALFADHLFLAVDAGILEFLMPFAVLVTFRTFLPDRESLSLAAACFVIGATLTSVAQTAAMLPHFAAQGFPLLADEFLRLKMDVAVQMAAGEWGYGNPGNYISLWVSVVPLLVGMFYWFQRKLLILAALGLVLYAGLAVYSRAGLLTVMLALVVFLSHRVFVAKQRSYLIVALLVVLGGIHLPATPDYIVDSIRDFFDAAGRTQHAGISIGPSITAPESLADDRGSTALDRGLATPDNGPTALDRSRLAEPDLSAVHRSLALGKGLAIALEALPFGIGYGSYHLADPEFTAPHSMAVLRLAEGGPLSLLSFLLLAAWAPIELIRMALKGDGDVVRTTALIAITAFYVKAIAFGATFAVSSNIVWGYCIALLMALALAAPELGPKPGGSSSEVDHRDVVHRDLRPL